MATLSTLGQMMLALDPQIKPYSEAELTANRIQGGQLNNQTALLQLADLQRQQEAQAAQRAYYQQHPEALLGQQPSSTLGALGPAGFGAASPGPITQSPMPGMPGAPQTVPASPDASRYAGVSPQGGGPIPPDVTAQMMPTVTPPQSTLGALWPPPQAPRNPLLDLARANPDAALAVQHRMQQQQEQQLKMRATIAEGIAMELQGATDQPSYDAARQRVAQISPQWAQALPQVYSKEAVQPWIERALGAKDKATLSMEQSRIQAVLRGQDIDLAKIQQQGGEISYEKDAQGNIVAVPKYAGGTGGVQSRPVLGPDGQPIKSLEGQKLTQQQQTQVRTQENELRTHVDTLLKDYYTVRDSMGRIEASGAEPSAAGDLALITAFMKMLDPSTGVRDVEFKNAASAGGFLEQIKARVGYVANGERLSEDMRSDLLERSRRLYAQYEKDYGQVKQRYRDLTTRLGGNPANVVLETGSTAAKPPTAAVTQAQLQEWATQRSKDLGRPVTVEEVRKDVQARGFRVEK